IRANAVSQRPIILARQSDIRRIKHLRLIEAQHQLPLRDFTFLSDQPKRLVDDRQQQHQQHHNGQRQRPQKQEAPERPSPSSPQYLRPSLRPLREEVLLLLAHSYTSRKRRTIRWLTRFSANVSRKTTRPTAKILW